MVELRELSIRLTKRKWQSYGLLLAELLTTNGRVMSCSSPWALIAQTAEQTLGITDDMRFLFRRIAMVAEPHDGLGTEVRDE